jgi:hypothetical protein
MSEGFQHAIAGGQGNLVISQLQSPNFKLSPLTGWAVLKNGAAYFADVVVSGSYQGTDFVINSAGSFFYSGTPAAGNLVLSEANGTGVDAYGNAYLAGNVAYSGSGSSWAAVAVSAAAVTYYTASSYAGPWTSQGSLVFNVTPAELQINFGLVAFSVGISTGGSAVIGGNLTVGVNATIDGTLTVDGALTASGGAAVTGGLATDTLTVGGSSNTGTPSNNNTSTNGLTDGTIHGTSGAQSAGTAHTHGPGSFAVGNGQHAHNLSSHLHPL